MGEQNIQSIDQSEHQKQQIVRRIICKSQFGCLRENTEKYKTFSVRIKKLPENSNTVTYKIKFIDSLEFMQSSLPITSGNLSEGLHKERWKNCESDLEYITAKEYTVRFKYVDGNKSYEKEFTKVQPIDPTNPYIL